MTKEDKNRREEGIHRLCEVLNVGWGYICDDFLTLQCGEPTIDPIKMDTLLKKRRLLKEDEESIRECLDRLYGKEIGELAESLI